MGADYTYSKQLRSHHLDAQLKPDEMTNGNDEALYVTIEKYWRQKESSMTFNDRPTSVLVGWWIIAIWPKAFSFICHCDDAAELQNKQSIARGHKFQQTIFWAFFNHHHHRLSFAFHATHRLDVFPQSKCFAFQHNFKRFVISVQYGRWLWPLQPWYMINVKNT